MNSGLLGISKRDNLASFKSLYNSSCTVWLKKTKLIYLTWLNRKPLVVLSTAPRRSAASDGLQQLTAAKPINRHPAFMDPEGSPLYCKRRKHLRAWNSKTHTKL